MVKIKQTLSLLLCAAMLLTSFSITVSADDTEDTPIADASASILEEIPSEELSGDENSLLMENSEPLAYEDSTYASENLIASGYCGGEGDGTNLSWKLTDDGTLTIGGTGRMADYNNWNTKSPWDTMKTSVKSVVIENGVTSIGNDAFNVGWDGSNGYVNFTSVTLPNTVTVIGDYAFNNCRALSSVTIPNGVTSIGMGAFQGCACITSIEIPSSVESIGDDAFNTFSLTSITVDAANSAYRSVDGVLFTKDMTALACYPSCRQSSSYSIPDGVVCIKRGAFRNASMLTELIIPNSLMTIGMNAFSYCANLESIEIPSSVTDIGTQAFSDCAKLSAILVNSANPVYGSVEGVLFTKDGTVIIYYPEGKQESSYSIPNGTKTIGHNAFYRNTWGTSAKNLTKVIIPNSVTSIGNEAFYGCSGLTSINLPDSVTSIGNNAFSQCSSLPSIVIPKSVEKMYRYVFSYCENLTDVYCEAESKPEGWDNDWLTYSWDTSCNATVHWGYNGGIPDDILASGYCGGEGNGTNLTWKLTEDGTLTISGTGKMADYNNWNTKSPWDTMKTSVKSVVIENGVTSIGNDAFNVGWDGSNGYVNFTSVTIPNTVTVIGDYAFNNCRALSSVTITNGVTSIGMGAFQGCACITSIEIPSSVESIGDCAFNTFSLTSITVDAANSAYRSVDGVLFTKDMTSLSCYPSRRQSSSYSIPDGVVSIKYGAFYNASMLTELIIPNSLTTIEGFAFCNCGSLEFIEIPSSVASIETTAFRECSKLSEILVSSANTVYGSIDGVLFTKDGTEIIYYPEGKQESSYSIPNGTKTIGNYAFYGNTWGTSAKNLTRVIIPDSVTSIGNQAFYGCSGLISIVIPQNVANMGSAVFAFCQNLADVYCAAETKPEGWADDWLTYSWETKKPTVHWGYGSSAVIYGDVDNDGKVTAKDRVTLARYLAGWAEYKDINETAADVDNDSRITAKDRVTLARHIAGWEEYKELPYTGK